MKLKKSKKFLKIILFILIFGVGIAVGNILSNAEIFSKGDTTTTTISEVEVGKQTIENTLTSSGEIMSSASKSLTLSTSKYFSKMCVEEDDIISKGDKILKYTDGTYLVAPYDCIIDSYSVPESGSICTSKNYVKIQNMKKLTMQIQVNESEINSIKKGQEVEIQISAIENKKYTGKITAIDNAGTYSTSGTKFNAEIEFQNDGNVKIGMSAECSITIEKVEDVVAVPIKAVQTKNDQKYVVVVKNDGTTENVDIETGISNDTYVQVKSGLSGGEKIQVVETVTTNNSKRRNSKSQNNFDMQMNHGEMPSGQMGGDMPGGGPGQNSGGRGSRSSSN